jgi:hypothetical protein
MLLTNLITLTLFAFLLSSGIITFFKGLIAFSFVGDFMTQLNEHAPFSKFNILTHLRTTHIFLNFQLKLLYK